MVSRPTVWVKKNPTSPEKGPEKGRVRKRGHPEKSAMLQRDEPESTDGVRHRPKRLHLRVKEYRNRLPRACLSRWYDHRFALLVYQGSDPTVPYQALVSRESARLFLGFTPWGQ